MVPTLRGQLESTGGCMVYKGSDPRAKSEIPAGRRGYRDTRTSGPGARGRVQRSSRSPHIIPFPALTTRIDPSRLRGRSNSSSTAAHTRSCSSRLEIRPDGCRPTPPSGSKPAPARPARGDEEHADAGRCRHRDGQPWTCRLRAQGAPQGNPAAGGWMVVDRRPAAQIAVRGRSLFGAPMDLLSRC